MNDLPWNHKACTSCALPYIPATTNHSLCGSCIKQEPSWDSMLSACIYAPPVSQHIAQLKFAEGLASANLLGHILLKRLQEQDPAPPPDFIMPVPLHIKRLRKRGFNQALEIARPISKGLGVLIDNQICQRHLETPEQSRLSAKQRRKNLKGAFVVTKDIHDKTIAIVDDVVTTGSTAAELSQTLRKAGARKIHIWSVARVPDNNHV